MFFANGYFYFFIIVLQAVCVIHCIRKGKQNNWIWIIVFLPIVGCLAYIFTEVFTGREMQNVQSGLGTIFNPGGKLKKLENNLRFSDTFNNRVALADACLEANQTNRAIELYESGLTGNFTENEYVLSKLVIAYFQAKRYDDILPVVRKIYKLPQFARSRAHILYATALGYTGNLELAEKEFKTMKTKFSNYEARYRYGRFLAGNGRNEEARNLFHEMVNESPHLSSRERRYNSSWISQAKDELRKLPA